MQRFFTIWMVVWSLLSTDAFGEIARGANPLHSSKKDPLFVETHPTHYPADGPHLGHADSRMSEYDIYADNCHSASNDFCTSDPSKAATRGILSCRDRSLGSLKGHTANWEVLGDSRTCIYNWGNECCFDGNQSPPDVSRGMARACARWACGTQFCDKTRCLDPGVLVEDPTINACVTQTNSAYETLPTEARQGSTPMSSCEDCCEQRADLWDGEKWGYDKQDRYFNGCKTACRNAFSPKLMQEPLASTEPPYESWAGVKAGRACKDLGSDKCKSCCMNKAYSKSIPRDAVTSCMRECSK